MSRPKRIALAVAGACTALLVALLPAGIFVLRSDWFRDQVRRRMVWEIERATGGRVEIAEFRFDWKGLTAEVRDFVLHGAEPAGAPPLVRAGTLRVGLAVISAFRRDIDIASLGVDRLAVNILVDENGRTNIPSPRRPRRPDTDLVDEFLKIAIRHFTIRNGEFLYDSRRIPIEAGGERFSAHFSYEAAGPSYRGDLSVQRLWVDAAGFKSMPLRADVALVVRKGRVDVASARLRANQSWVEAAGALSDLKRLAGEFRVDARARMDEIAGYLPSLIAPRGYLELSGEGSFGDGFLFAGKIAGQGLGLHRDNLEVRDVRLASKLKATAELLELDGLSLAALGGAFHGRARLAGLERFEIEGEASGFALEELALLRPGAGPVAWSGVVAGPVKLKGSLKDGALHGFEVRSTLAVSPRPGARPLEGRLELSYDQQSGTVQLGDSSLATPRTRVSFRGALGRSLAVEMESSDLDDFIPALALAGRKAPATLPVTLKGGRASFRGTVTGAADDLLLAGRVNLTGFLAQGHSFDRMQAEFQARADGLNVRTVRLEKGGLRLEGQGRLGLTEWGVTDSSALSFSFSLRAPELRKLLVEAGRDLPVEGALTASGAVEGTAASPSGTAQLRIERPGALGETFDRLNAKLRFTPASIAVESAQLDAGKSRLEISGAFERSPAGWNEGEIRFDAASRAWPIEGIRNLQQAAAGLAGKLALRGAGRASLRASQLRLTALDGEASLRELVWRTRPLGSVQATAQTAAGKLAVTASGELCGSKVRAGGAWRLDGDYAGSGRADFSPALFTALAALAAPGKELPFEGFVAGDLDFSVPLTRPAGFRSAARFTAFELRPRVAPSNLREAVRRDLVLRNASPVLLRIDDQGVRIESAKFAARDTGVEVTGGLLFGSSTPWNLQVKGDVDLALAQTFYPHLVTKGRAALNATVRGALEEPQVGGRMELENASVYLADVLIGVDKANGTVTFDRNRANLERLTAQVGGGEMTLRGFVGFGLDELVFRLQAEADKVRVRYPEGVSTTISASLSLTGTSTRSLLAGTATIERAAFNPRTDLGSLLAQASKPVATPVTPPAALRGLEFDVRVVSSPDIEFQTSLAQRIQAEADLRFRGTLARPVVLGRVAINQGEIQFFGNKYTITRGDVAFYNPARIEPVVIMDLETKVRGVTVNINFSGPPNKLNMTYRSDPPLESSEIIALLAVGREPGVTPTVTSSRASGGQSFLGTGADTLLGQAVASPVASRLQRFFGVSRLKIDPRLTGLDTTPQARLTIEQQISRDITLTYVTNLTKTQQQLVQVEWNLSKDWSLLAVRDENGVFGLDFLFKKRFR